MSVVDVVSLCAFPGGAVLWEAQPGQLSLTVMVKATFALVPGEAVVAEEQDPLAEERHWDDNALASVHWPGDFAPSKRRVDVTLVGHAYAPPGEPVTSLTARLTVGDLVKAVHVTGDRSWTAGAEGPATPGPPAPFLRMPLRYERAALSADNPIGVDTHVSPAQSQGGAPALPNLTRVQGGEGTPCFGPVAPTWRARRRLLDETATFWAYGIARDPQVGAPPLGPLPARFDFAFFNAAPADQQIDILRQGAPLVLEHLHPDHARLETRLPLIRPQVFRVPPPDTPRARVEEIVLRCDSLWIDTDRGVAVTTWRGLADVGRSADGVGRVVIAADSQGKKLRWEQVERRLGETTIPTLRLGKEDRGAPERQDESPAPDPLALRHDTVKGQRGPEEVAPGGSPESSIEDPPTNQIDRGRDEDRTQALPELSRPPPSKRAPLSMPKPPAPPVTAGPPESLPRPPLGPPSSKQPPARPILVMGSPLGKPAATLVSAGSTPRNPRPTAPMIRTGAPPSPEAIAPAAPAAPAAPGPPPIPRAAGPSLRKDLTVQRYAEIAAALAHRGADRATVLRAHLLTGPAWSMVEQHWKKAMAAEEQQGSHALSDDFDEAYVSAQERAGRAVDVAAFARLQVGVERGEVGRALADLELELGDLVRLQRVWARRVAASPELAVALERAVAAAREQGS